MRALLTGLAILLSVAGSAQLPQWNYVVPDTDRIRVLPLPSGSFAAITYERTVTAERLAVRLFDASGSLYKKVVLYEEWASSDHFISAAYVDESRIYVCLNGRINGNDVGLIGSCKFDGSGAWRNSLAPPLSKACASKGAVLYVASDYRNGPAQFDRARVTRYNKETGSELGSTNYSNVPSYVVDIAAGPGNVLYLGGYQSSATGPLFIARLRDDGSSVFFRTFNVAPGNWQIPSKLGFDAAQSRVYLAGVVTFDSETGDHFVVSASTTTGVAVASRIVDLHEGGEEFGGLLVNNSGLYLYAGGFARKPLKKLNPNLTDAWTYDALTIYPGSVALGFHGDVLLAAADDTRTWILRLDATSGAVLTEIPLGSIPVGYPKGLFPDAAGGFLEWGTNFVGYVQGVSYLQKHRAGLLSFPVVTMIGGNAMTGTLTLPAPAIGDKVISLTSANSTAVQVPPTVTVAGGGTSVTFNLTSTPVATNTSSLITANASGLVLQQTVTLTPPVLTGVTVSPNSVFGGVNTTGTVTLSGKAPVAGWSVALASNHASATVPASVTVVSGTDSASFTISTAAVLVNTGVVVSATKGSVLKTAFMAVNAPIFSSFTAAPSSVVGGSQITLTLTLGTVAPSGYVIQLVSGAPGLVIVPSSTAMTAGSTTKNLSVGSNAVTSTTPITLVAYRGPYVKTATVTLTP